MFLVVSVQRPEVDACEDVAVDDQDRFGSRRDEAERSSGPEWLVLLHVCHLDGEAAAVPEVLDDRFGLVVRRHDDVVDARIVELPDDALQERPPTDRQHRFRHVVRQRSEPHPAAPRHDHRSERVGRLRQQVLKEDHVDDSPIAVKDRELAYAAGLHQRDLFGRLHPHRAR